MSAFHTIAKWSLRALVLWGAFELGTGVYDQATLAWQQSEQIAGHQQAMKRLEDRATAFEATARAAASRSTSDAAMWRLTASGDNSPLHQRAAEHLRETLMSLGAQAPVVNGSAGQGAMVQLNATWRESQATAPAILHTLARQYPQLEVRQLKITSLSDAGIVSVEAQLQARVAAEPSP